MTDTADMHQWSSMNTYLKKQEVYDTMGTFPRKWVVKSWDSGGGVLPYVRYMGMCRCEGYGFQAV